MNKVTEIIKAWGNKVFPTPEMEEKAKIRYSICSECTNRGKNAVGIEVCKLCGCPLEGKVFTPKTPAQDNCPDKRWPV